MPYTLRDGDLITLPISANTYNTKGVFSKASDLANYHTIPIDVDEKALIYCVHFDATNPFMYVAHDKRVIVYDTSQPNLPIIKTFSGSKFRSVTSGGGLVLIASGSSVVLCDPSNAFSVVATWTPQNTTNRFDYASAKLSEDGSTIIKVNDTNVDKVDIIRVADLVVTHTFTKTTNTSYPTLLISRTGKYIGYQTANDTIAIYNTITNTATGTLTRMYDNPQHANVCYSFADEDYMLVATGYSSTLKVVNLANATKVDVMTSATQILYVARVSPSEISISASTAGYKVNLLTFNETTKTMDVEVIVDHGAATPPCRLLFKSGDSVNQFEVSDVITETLQIDLFEVLIVTLKDSIFVARELVPAGTFNISVFSSDPVIVTIIPHINRGMWKGSESYELGDLIYSNNPLTNDWVFKCAQQGVSATFAPPWQTSPTTQFADGTVIWEVVEPIQMPITNTPVLPTVV